MANKDNSLINASGIDIAIKRLADSDYISLTDMAKYRNSQMTGEVIRNWLRTRYTIEFMGVWERVNNTNFNIVDFEHIRNESGSNSFMISVANWVEKTNAIGIYASAGRYGGTYAHKDIAFEFATWLSPEFKYYLIHEFDRLKQNEAKQQSLEWNISRTLSKINYRIHTDAVKEFLIPPELTSEQASFKYAQEADVLNMALFGKTAKQWREENPKDSKIGNMRDFAPLEHLIVLSNLESINSVLIGDKLPQKERLLKLNKTAITQLKSLYTDKRIGKLKGQSPQKQISST